MITEAIAKYLNSSGIKTKDLCLKTGLDESFLINVLNGEQSLSVDEYAQLCGALKLPLNYFFEAKE